MDVRRHGTTRSCGRSRIPPRRTGDRDGGFGTRPSAGNGAPHASSPKETLFTGSLSSRDHRRMHFRGSCRQQCSPAFPERRSGRRHVIDQQDRQSANRVACLERVTDVLAACFAPQRRLRRCRPHTPEPTQIDREIAESRERSRKALGLIESALPLSRRVQRHRNDRPRLPRHDLVEKPCEMARQKVVLPELERLHRFFQPPSVTPPCVKAFERSWVFEAFDAAEGFSPREGRNETAAGAGGPIDPRQTPPATQAAGGDTARNRQLLFADDARRGQNDSRRLTSNSRKEPAKAAHRRHRSSIERTQPFR
jgi:hypothetical protein